LDLEKYQNLSYLNVFDNTQETIPVQSTVKHLIISDKVKAMASLLGYEDQLETFV
jgi:hypothetical protein